MVTLAAEGAVCVLAEAVIPTDGFIDTLINICKARAHREVSTALIFTAPLCTIDFLNATVNAALLFQNKHNYHFDLTITTQITAFITCQKERMDSDNSLKGFSNSADCKIIQGDLLSASTW